MRFFVTGTDTGVGKSEVSASLLRAMVARGETPFAWKPCETGGDADSTKLWQAAGAWQRKEDVCTFRFKQPLAPAIAAQLEKKKVDVEKLKKVFKKFGPGPGVVEGAGGLHVPLTPKHDVIDLIAALKLPVVLVGRAGLGTINHTTLSVNALRERKIPIAAIVLSQAERLDDASVRHNAPQLRKRFPKTPVLGPVPFRTRPSEREAFFDSLIETFLGSEFGYGQPTSAK